MKILVVSHLWPRRDWSNFGAFVSEQTAALAQRCDVSVAVPVDRTARRGEINLGQLLSGFKRYRYRTRPDLILVNELEPVEIAFHSGIMDQAKVPKAVDSLSRALDENFDESFDVVHAHTLFPDGMACARWLDKSDTPLVVTAHGSDVHSIPEGVRRGLASVINRADAVIPVSGFLRGELTKLGFEEDRLRVIPNGFPGHLFAGVEDSYRDTEKIVFLGNLRDVKRVDLLIRAIPYLPRAVHLEIAGEGPSRVRLERLVAELRLEDRVSFHGIIARRDVPRFLAGAALMCLVSSKEGWPTVIYEALVCGTPVLATSVGGVPEALADPGLGVLIPDTTDPEALAGEIRDALAREWDRQHIMQTAQQFSWDELSKKIMTLYQGLMGDRNTHSAASLSARGD